MLLKLTEVVTNAGRKFHKDSKEKQPIKIRLEIKSQNYGCLLLLDRYMNATLKTQIHERYPSLFSLYRALMDVEV
jgi:hypothetical protein